MTDLLILFVLFVLLPIASVYLGVDSRNLHEPDHHEEPWAELRGNWR